MARNRGTGTGLPPLLYLDTARLGQMTPAARDAQLDFVRLTAEEPSSLYFEEFLRNGYSAWPAYYQRRFPGLRTWLGVAELKRSICRLINAPDDRRILLASRSLSLVHLASSCMFHVCRNVLTTDLSWPTYQQTLESKASRTDNWITTVPLRDNVLYGRWTIDDVAGYLASKFIEHRCDGLFLPAVDHLGIRLPIRSIVERIHERSELRFCFIDAAQTFCHVRMDDCLEFADFIVAGSHKWMGAYLPMGIGLFGRPQSREMIERPIRQFCQAGYHVDPLLHFSEQLEGDHVDGHSETANLTALFACAGAVSDKLTNCSQEIANGASFVGQKLAAVPRPSADWQLLSTNEFLRSRIVLFESIDSSSESAPPEITRRKWLNAGCVVTAYAGGRVRISLAS